MANYNKWVRQLNHKDVEKRIEAINALGELRDKRAMMPLMSASTKKENLDNIRVLDALTRATSKIQYGF